MENVEIQVGHKHLYGTSLGSVSFVYGFESFSVSNVYYLKGFFNAAF